MRNRYRSLLALAATSFVAVSLLAGVRPACAATTREVIDSLLPRLGEKSAPGDVLFREDFAAGNLDKWKPDQGWSVVDNPDGGKCGKVVSSDLENEDLILKAQIPIVPGHPIAVYWKTRFVSGSDPLYLRVDFFDADGKTGKPYARQDTSHEGPNWTENAMLVSDWFPPYTRAITIWFHHNPKANTTSLLSDVKVVDLARPVSEIVSAELPALRAKCDSVAGALTSLPKSPVADSWRALARRQLISIRQELDDAGKLAPGSPEMQKAIERPATYLARLNEAVAGLKQGTVTTQGLLVYATRPVSSQMVLPYSAELPGTGGRDARSTEPARSTRSVEITACPGETESASLVLWTPEDRPGVMLRVSELRGPGGVIPAAAVDVKWVKCWYQAGSAPHGVSQDRSHKVLVPELLLNDDSLVKVDLATQHNFLKLAFAEGARYVPIDDPTPPKPTWGFAYKLSEFPVKDAATLQPADLPEGQNKQVWVTVKVPDNARAGRYTGKIALSAGGAGVSPANGGTGGTPVPPKPVPPTALGEVAFTVNVLPFKLNAPRTHYDLTRDLTGSLYYWGQLDPTGAGTIGFNMKSEEQFRAELKMMWDHGIVAPAMILPPKTIYDDEPLFRRYLKIMQEFGMSGRPLYFADSSVVGNPTDPTLLAKLKDNVRKTIRIAKEYGFTDVYFYGIDEATGDTLKSEKIAWQAVHEAGGKIIVSGFQGQLEAVGDMLDLFNKAGDPSGENVAEWHKRGHLVWNYANPQTPVEDPLVYRRNYGLFLWKCDLDGACTYCFMDSSGTQWNDFDDDTYRDHCLAYPTVNGVVGTLAIEGFREGMDDIRYATTLEALIRKVRKNAAPSGRMKPLVMREWLDDQDMRTADLDVVRQGIIQRILELSR